MLGYHDQVDLEVLKQQLVDSVELELVQRSDQGVPVGSSSPAATVRHQIGEGICLLQAGHKSAGLALLKEALGKVSKSLLALVCGDLAISLHRPMEAARFYGLVDSADRSHFIAASARKGRAYTSVLRKWLEYGLKPVIVITYGGEGGDVYLLELVPDPERAPTRDLTTSMSRRLAGLGTQSAIYIEMTVTTLGNERFADDELPIYGLSPVSNMGPYIFGAEDARNLVMHYADQVFRELNEHGVKNWRQLVVAGGFGNLSRRLRMPEYYAKFVTSNDELANEMICGRKDRWPFPGGGKWFDYLKSFEKVQ